ncbi:MAG TPA: hypothetical protein VLS28_11990 [Candidatus Sulfomarinibacteraceae bacterium]|nr:hypothetical protein [Candidatus Sulfomarinibacteraceae bacterium]
MLSERLVYRPWMCLETTLAVRRSGDGSLEVEQSAEPDVVCCRGSLAYVGDSKPRDPTPSLGAVEGLGRTTSSSPLGGATTQYVGAGAGSLWFPLEDLGKVARVDAESGEIETLINTGDPEALAGLKSDPHGVAVGDAGIWVAQAAARAVGRIDPETNAIADSIPVAVVPYALALDGPALWATSFEDDLVVRVDLSTGKVVAEIPVTKPTGIAIGLGSAWVVEHRNDSLVRIDSTTNEVVARIVLGGRGPSETCGMCVENVIVSDGSVWTANNEARSVTRIDPASNAVAATVDLPLRVWAVTGGGGAIWASQFEATADGSFVNQPRWAVARIDPETNESTSFTLPGALSVTWAGEALWVVTPGRRGDIVIRLEPDPS